MAVYTPKQMAVVALSITPTDLYTAPAGGAIVNSISLCNTGTVTRAVTLKLAGKSLASALAITAKETVILAPNHALVSADTLNASQDVGTDVELIASGVEIS